MKNFYITFGVGTPFGKAILRVRAPSKHAVHDWANKAFVSWARVYDAREGAEQARQWSLQIINCPEQAYPTEWF